MTRYDGAGKNRSAMVHATRRHSCGLCPKTGLGNGFDTSHGRAHVRRGEAVELVKEHGYPHTASRLFLPVGDVRIAEWQARGYEVAS